MAESPAGRLVAAVDCGSNSTRLLIAPVGGAGSPAAVRRARITRLGAGVDASGRLSDDALARVAGVLEDYARQWRDAGVDTVAVTATSAVRDAADPQRFLQMVHEVTGVDAVVLTGAQEAAYTFGGATAGGRGRTVVCDIGGGSTELIVGDGSVEQWVSLRLGSVRLRERHLHDDPPSPDQYAGLIADIDATLATLPDTFAAASEKPLVAVAGTALTVAAVAVGSLDPDIDVVDGTVLPVSQVAQVTEDLAWLSADQRMAHPAVVHGREDVIVAGAMLLARMLTHLGHDAVQVRVADLLDDVARRAASGAWPPASQRNQVPRRPESAGQTQAAADGSS